MQSTACLDCSDKFHHTLHRSQRRLDRTGKAGVAAEHGPLAALLRHGGTHLEEAVDLPPLLRREALHQLADLARQVRLELCVTDLRQEAQCS